MDQNLRRFRVLHLPALAAIAIGTSAISSQAQMLESFATTSGSFAYSNTTAAASTNYTDIYTGSYAEAYSRTNYGYNHAYAKVALPSPNSYFHASASSRYSDTLSFFVTNGMAGYLTPTSVRYTVTMDGIISGAPGFDTSSIISIGSGTTTDGLHGSSTTDVTATLHEDIGTDEWQLANSVNGTTYTSQSYALSGGTDSITMTLYAGVSAQTSSLPGTAYVDFQNTATLSGVEVYDQNGNLIPMSDLQILSGSGRQYAFMPSTPEPTSVGFGIGIAAAALISRRRRKK